MTTDDLGAWGLEKRLDVAVELVAPRAALASLAKAVAAIVNEADTPSVTVKLAGLEGRSGDVSLTLAIDLGSVSQIREGSEYSRAAVNLLATLVSGFKAYTPTLVQVPAQASASAAAARRWLGDDASVDSTGSMGPVLQVLHPESSDLVVV